MGKAKFTEQAEKLKNLVGSARLQTSSPATASSESSATHQANTGEPESTAIPVEQSTVERPRTKAKNLKAIPLTYYEAHERLKKSSKTSLDFSSYIMEALREKFERDGAFDKE